MAQRGRKSKLTKELIQEAANIIKMGNYVEAACDYLGIHRSTWYKWLSEGEKAKGGLKKEFFDAIKKAEAEAQIRNIGIIQTAAKESWQAAAWYLERRYPEQWGRRNRIDANLEHSGNLNHTHQIDLSKLSFEELEALEKIASKMQSEDELMKDEK